MKNEGRRPGITIKIDTSRPEKPGHVFFVTYNYDLAASRWFECFYSGGLVAGSDFANLASDACIAVSKLIEKGATFEELSRMFGEDRLPGADRGPPASILGTIAAVGAGLTDEWRARE